MSETTASPFSPPPSSEEAALSAPGTANIQNEYSTIQQYYHYLENAPNQIILGTAILRADTGELIPKLPSSSPSPALSTTNGTSIPSSQYGISANDQALLYQMLNEVGYLLQDDANNGEEDLLQRVNIQGGDDGIQYSMCVTKDGFIFIVKKLAK